MVEVRALGRAEALTVEILRRRKGKVEVSTGRTDMIGRCRGRDGAGVGMIVPGQVQIRGLRIGRPGIPKKKIRRQRFLLRSISRRKIRRKVKRCSS